MSQFSSALAAGREAFAIVPSATVNFIKRARGIYVGGAGNVAIVGTDGVVTTFIAPPVGSIIPVECIRVNVVNTTATNLVGLV